ncbi:MAG: hypothetical protein EAX96_15045 [Candidatus Lokiarchaeota archaeon]|nr:hypothetical protein [Candidatus Lokiarchaeota archaeon]
MGFLLTYLFMFAGSLIIQWIYSTKKVQKNIAWIAYASMFWLIFFWILDGLIVFGVFDWLLIQLNHIPFVSLPTQNTGIYWYYNCLLLGLFDLKIPVQASFGTIFFAICLETSYMVTFRSGQGWGRAMFGKRPNQSGILPFLMPLKKPKYWHELEQKWKDDAPKRETNEQEANKMIEEGLALSEKIGMKNKIRGFKR